MPGGDVLVGHLEPGLTAALGAPLGTSNDGRLGTRDWDGVGTKLCAD